MKNRRSDHVTAPAGRAGPGSSVRVTVRTPGPRVRQGGRMQLRRTLPLTLAALALTAGCMTVRPAGPPGPAAPAAARSAVARPAAAPLPEPLALPLGPLPSPSGAAEQPPDAPEAPVAAAAPEQADPLPPPRPVRPLRPERAVESEAHRARPPKAAHPVRPRPAAKPRPRAAARPKARPAPRSAYDMASLCSAARGMLDSSIVALCTGRFGG
ncbi:hypothetical protein ACIQF5_01420 [Streptomyces goshikiensis]|uniref:hypothetical protein n=1 Tax=Streptomyces goshikiensis TaxID=1942 RepID=UPI003812BE2C